MDGSQASPQSRCAKYATLISRAVTKRSGEEEEERGRGVDSETCAIHSLEAAVEMNSWQPLRLAQGQSQYYRVWSGSGPIRSHAHSRNVY